MSHQQYSNYMTLMEAECAVLQDIGYTIARRNLFGYSVYNHGITLINDNPYFGRNSQGMAYIANTYKMATVGLGLHGYGSNNRIIRVRICYRRQLAVWAPVLTALAMILRFYQARGSMLTA